MACDTAPTMGAKSAPDTIQIVIRDFDPLIERVFKIAAAIDLIGDKLEGSRPQEAAQGQVDTPPHGMLDELQRKRSGFDRAVNVCERNLARLERALGFSESDFNTLSKLSR